MSAKNSNFVSEHVDNLGPVQQDPNNNNKTKLEGVNKTQPITPKSPPEKVVNKSKDSDSLIEFPSNTGFGVPSDPGKDPPSVEDVGESFIDQKVFWSGTSKEIHNIYCLAIICNVHNKIVLEQMPNQCYFFPMFRLSREQSFNKIFKDIIGSILPAELKTLPAQIIEEWRIKLPKTNTYVSRYIFKTLIYFDDDAEELSRKCCIDTKTIRWFNRENFEKILNSTSDFAKPTPGYVHLWGLEPYYILQSSDYCLTSSFRESEFEELFQPKSGLLWEIIQTVNYDENDLKTIFNEFVVHCYPSEMMTFPSFFLFAIRISINCHYNFESLKMLFDSFDENRSYSLTFQDLIIGFGLMENRITFRNSPNLIEQRFKSLFRFYDSNGNGLLRVTDLSSFINDYYERINSMLVDVEIIPNWMKDEAARESNIKNIFMKYSQDSNLNLSGLENVIKEMAENYPLLPNMIEVLHRLPYDVVTFGGAKFCYEKSFQPSYYALYRHNEMRCQSCYTTRFSLSNQLIYLSHLGEIFDIVRLEPFAKKDNEEIFMVDIPEKDIYLLTNDILIRLQRLALFLFNEQVQLTESNYEDYLINWFFPNQNEMFEAIRMILQEAIEIFSKEKRVLQIQSPCYVFGDIHGNFKDLISYSQHFWKCSPFFNTGKYLFLGDYVDRGTWGIEVVIFLFCFKILAPSNFFLIRGNHEIREVQKQFSFLGECTVRLTIELWEMFNECFDRMPIAAIIDDRLYCAHGGIPTSVTSLTQLNSVPLKLPNPSFNCNEAWETFWNDPINNAELAFLHEDERSFISISRGFARNIKRGTAYLYSEEAVDNFCQKNQVEYILRAHEVYQEGFFFYSHGKVITIFSSSKYSFLDNRAAVLFVDNNTIRVIKIEI